MSSLASEHLKLLSPRGRAVPSAVNGPVPCRPPPSPLQGWLLHRPGQNRRLSSCARALHDSPFGGSWPLTYGSQTNVSLPQSLIEKLQHRFRISKTDHAVVASGNASCVGKHVVFGNIDSHRVGSFQNDFVHHSLRFVPGATS